MRRWCQDVGGLSHSAWWCAGRRARGGLERGRGGTGVERKCGGCVAEQVGMQHDAGSMADAGNGVVGAVAVPTVA